ncbi:hypothetical protein RJ639_046905 [Escallonia herrerae]|uniref:Disease resistance R13L4/SHOC-2-like LRR domain-containing protein n=1 Tax=Escallonia herrerae TaxID=1293975 RepID=A0AA88WAB2_9ASTE|nr:hypothetical protein RJ639_046905 [Escallonia herrerae]
MSELVLSDVRIPTVLPMNLSSSLTYLDLSDTWLQGKLPDGIFHLPKLQKLVLRDNYYLGEFPKLNWNCNNSLQVLSLSGTSFSGELLDSVSHLKSLSYLELIECKLSGPIPESLGNLTHITVLLLFFNNLNNRFEGEIPDWFGNLQKLRELSLSSNSFSGQFPSWVTNLTLPKALELNSNSLTGTMPSDISGFQDLIWLDLSHNSFNGTILSWLFTLPSLELLDAGSNQLRGFIHEFQYDCLIRIYFHSNATLPSSVETVLLSSCGITELDFLRTTRNLITLELSQNKIEGHFPNWASSKLKEMFLTGFILLPSVKLVYLDLRSNLFQGPIPVPPPTTSIFFISHNKLTGKIPPSLCNLSSLKILVLSHNSLSGLVPKCLHTLSNQRLSVLDLQGNHGIILTTFARKGNLLRSLNLNGNQLEGSVPRSLAHCSRLEVLNIGNNKLNGTFPHWLKTLPELQVLVLKSNKLHGPLRSISNTEFSFPKLRILDLSYNEFTGLLPAKYFKSFRGMMNVNENSTRLMYMGDPVTTYQDSITEVMKGMEIELVRILTVFATLDLSSNMFEGDIPDCLTSHNSLAGHIPSLLGAISELESLDLSSNQITGEMPEELTNLTFLAVLNLSQNRLVGRIPHGSQFNTFRNDSTMGTLYCVDFRSH